MLAPPFDAGAVHDRLTDEVDAAVPDTAVGAPGAVAVVYVKDSVFDDTDAA